jgi:hypothetical protein
MSDTPHVRGGFSAVRPYVFGPRSPEAKPYDERQSGVRDAYGNVW